MEWFKRFAALALLVVMATGLGGCGATLWGGKFQEAQSDAAVADAEDTQALAEMVKALVNDPKVSPEAKGMGMAMGMMAYQAKQHGDHFKPKGWDSPVETNWVQAVWASVMGVFASKSGGGSERVTEKTSSSNTYIEKISSSNVERVGQ